MNKNLHYEENRNLELEDVGYDSPLYKITLYDTSFLISIGKERKLLTKKNHYYFPVYLMNKFHVQTQIGAFEYESMNENQVERMKRYMDKSGDVDLNLLGDIVLYSFADYDYFNDIVLGITPLILSEMETKYAATTIEATEDEEQEQDNTNEPFELGKGDIKPSTAMSYSEKVLKNGIFEIDTTIKRPATLEEETKDASIKTKTEYRERKGSEWIEQFMKNNHYDIVETDNNGDCLFDTIRQAYAQVGYKTTVQKLRALVAKEATDEMFIEYRELYQGFLMEKDEIEKEMRRLVTVNKELKKRLKNIPTTDKLQRSQIVTEANIVAQQHKDLKDKHSENNSLLGEFEFMKGVDSLDKLREIIQTTTYWADNWCISVLERELNVKLVIFSESSYHQNDKNNVLQCNIAGPTATAAAVEGHGSSHFSPELYIFTTYSGNHYRLITYKNKRIFRFSEIPYDVKIMVVIKCMEHNSGVFNNIIEFRNFKSKLGIDTGSEISGGGRDIIDNHIHGGAARITDDSTVFVFYNKSNGLAKAGKGQNEKIHRNKWNDYSDLNLKKNMDWRKKLDDDWQTIFTVDNMKWKTVEHYYQAAKFKKHNPHFYKMFSLDNGESDIAKDIDIARAAGSQKGAYKKGKTEVQLRPHDVRIDPDFYGNRKYDERETALYAKFSQNDDLRTSLLATKDAVLKKHIPKSVAEEDHILMKVRKQIQMES